MLNHVGLLATSWTVARQAPLSMELLRQENWSRLPFLPAGDLGSPGTEPASLASPALADGLFTISTTCEAQSLGRTGVEGSSFHQPWSVS